MIPTATGSSDRSRSQSPMNTAAAPPSSSTIKKDLTPPPPPPVAVATPPSTKPPPPSSTTSSTDAARKSSFSDLEKELQEFDIDLDKDDVSDVDYGQSTGANKISAEEDEVKP